MGEQNYPVSHVEEFLLVSTEPGGYRKAGNDGGLSAGRRTWGRPDERLFKAQLPDFFEVDYVRMCVKEIVMTLLITFSLVVLVCYLFLTPILP